ncbi:MAG: hypothetical protein KatS3mg124_2213 [Porticoccaceae bacterium]|nr:MAG: hypothetical protein KatS3mg124_2213 [Porticoccaceae bacterium]
MTRPLVTIRYCPACRWLPRAAWLAQELLETFAAELEGVLLRPSDTPGELRVEVDGEPLWDRKRDGFPEPAALKRRLRDRIAPQRRLGHADRTPP